MWNVLHSGEIMLKNTNMILMWVDILCIFLITYWTPLVFFAHQHKAAGVKIEAKKKMVATILSLGDHSVMEGDRISPLESYR